MEKRIRRVPIATVQKRSGGMETNRQERAKPTPITMTAFQKPLNVALSLNNPWGRMATAPRISGIPLNTGTHPIHP
jgi:hypothetical protein